MNHIAKRMGTALRKVASDGKKAGMTLGGCGEERLTHSTITKLTGYYGKVIRSHRGNKDAMRAAVFATLFHSMLTDDPHHSQCPVGRDSWCFFKRALLTGEKPESWSKKVGTPLSREVTQHVKDVYV